MEISLPIAVGERPVACLTSFVPYNGTDAYIHKLTRADDRSQFDLKKKRQGVMQMTDAERQRPNGRIRLHPFAISGKAENIPVAGRREIEFPISGRTLDSDEEFETSFFPKGILTDRHIRSHRNRNFRQASQKIIVNGQPAGNPGDFAFDL